MMRLVDHYPETLRDIYDKIEQALIEIGAVSATVDIPFYATEWIRKNWSARTLIPKWWGISRKDCAKDSAEAELPGVESAVDSVRSERGRELRNAVWEILATRGIGRPCEVAGAIASLVEAEWSTQQVYVPKAEAVDRAIRDARVWADFNGFATIGTVVSKHGLSQSMIYTISRRLQKDKEAREQPSLF